MADDTVDVLIIGAGASGAAMAWSLADTKMRIVCLEQGGWVKPTDYPANGRDWEARRYGDADILPNRRALPADYPVNDDNSVMKVANFNGVGGGTVRADVVISVAAGFPVAAIAGEIGLLGPIPLLQAQDAHLRLGEAPRHGRARRAGADDQDIDLLIAGHVSALPPG